MYDFNAFKSLETRWMSQLPPELEFQVSSQVRMATAAGRVMEIFVPNALRTAAYLIGGSSPTRVLGLPSGKQIEADPFSIDWRQPPKHY
ncbi:MAG: hypothetical protein NZM43_12910 [Saprospiraceae bacterium]|nr:hypothetical protein [Saprospiraceae bacterium]MDW8485214.1 hypothetical protein [Saprospiraceae bacterium]